jgi:alpha/beta superfamily hydrolase
MVQPKKETEPVKRPSIWKYIGEHIKVWIELIKFIWFKRTYRPKKDGDGHPVLVLPGFMTSDWSTKEYRKYLHEFGYTPYGWGLGRNYGGISELNLLANKIDLLYEQHQEPVSLIGWSLGGVYARQLAKAKPEKIRQVITVCSPFAGIDKPNNAAWLYKLVSIGLEIDEEDRKKWTTDIISTPPVPTTALFSKDDGIVPWQVCMEPLEDDIHQNVEIEGTHFGLGFKPSVLRITQDRLKYSKDHWQKF